MVAGELLVCFYGVPSADSPWGWQFGGHHLALNISIDNDEVTSMSPSFVGTEPAHFTYDGVEYTAVDDMHEAGYAIYQAWRTIREPLRPCFRFRTMLSQVQAGMGPFLHKSV